jgi:hypothetical protein
MKFAFSVELIEFHNKNYFLARYSVYCQDVED